MGNALSEEEEEELLEEAYTMSLESPDADRYLNSGTAAPNCQPKRARGGGAAVDGEGGGSGEDGTGGQSSRHRRASSSLSEEDQDEWRKRQQASGNAQSQQQKKLSYFQMARLGYQELVNAIIRPPRADYKVRRAATQTAALRCRP